MAKATTIITLTLTAISLHLPSTLYESIHNLFNEPAIIIGILALIAYFLFSITSLPFDYFKNYHMEHKYGLTKINKKKWIIKKTKKDAVIFGLILVVFEGIYGLTRLDVFWFFIGLAVIAVFLVLQAIRPFAPIESQLHNEERLENKKVLARFRILSNKAGLKQTKIYKTKNGDGTKELTADSSGLAKSKKICLSQNLLKKCSLDEIESILGHEIGHHKYRHQLKFSIILALVLCSSILGTYIIGQSLFEINIWNVADWITNLPVLALMFGIIYTAFIPIVNSFSRHTESQCDQFELDLVNKPKAFLSSIVKLYDQNLRYANPNRITEILFYDHPSGKRRINRAKTFLAPSFSN